jgi:hypothetical protein
MKIGLMPVILSSLVTSVSTSEDWMPVLTNTGVKMESLKAWMRPVDFSIEYTANASTHLKCSVN